VTGLLSKGRLVLLLVAAAVLAAPSAAQSAPVHAWLADGGLLPETRSFSELSIKQYDALYTTVTFEGEVRVDVVATNTSRRAARYRWSASVGPQGDAIRVDEGRLSLAGGATKEISLHFTIPDCRVRNKIAVRLVAPGQRTPEVHYWVLPHGSAAWKISGGPSCAA
jgi:hypothetical protein